MRRQSSRLSGDIVIWSGILGLLVAGLVAILPGAIPAQAQTGTPPPAGNVLFEDDFATYSGRWEEKITPKASVAYRDATLEVLVASPGASAWSMPDFDLALTDFSLEVTIAFQDGSADSWAGVLFDFEDEGQFYALLVASDGQWRWLERDGPDWHDLTPEDATPAERDNAEAPVRLRLDVTGDTLAVAIDAEPAGELPVVRDETWQKFGLIARAGRGYVRVSFDDVIVTTFNGAHAS